MTRPSSIETMNYSYGHERNHGSPGLRPNQPTSAPEGSAKGNPWSRQPLDVSIFMIRASTALRTVRANHSGLAMAAIGDYVEKVKVTQMSFQAMRLIDLSCVQPFEIA